MMTIGKKELIRKLEKEEVFKNDLEKKKEVNYLKGYQSKSLQNARRNGIKRVLSITNLKMYRHLIAINWIKSTQHFFELFFDDQVVNLMVDMTNLFDQRDKGKHNFIADANEMRLFLAMLLLTGYNQSPRREIERIPPMY